MTRGMFDRPGKVVLATGADSGDVPVVDHGRSEVAASKTRGELE